MDNKQIGQILLNSIQDMIKNEILEPDSRLDIHEGKAAIQARFTQKYLTILKSYAYQYNDALEAIDLSVMAFCEGLTQLQLSAISTLLVHILEIPVDIRHFTPEEDLIFNDAAIRDLTNRQLV